MSSHPETDAAYRRAGMRIDNQLDELDKTCRRLEAALATLLIAIDQHGEGRSMMHPRLSMAISAAKSAMPAQPRTIASALSSSMALTISSGSHSLLR